MHGMPAKRRKERRRHENWGSQRPVDVLAEIEPFMDRFRHVREGEGKISMASPFREDNSPSFVLFTDGNSGIGLIWETHCRV